MFTLFPLAVDVCRDSLGVAKAPFKSCLIFGAFYSCKIWWGQIHWEKQIAQVCKLLRVFKWEEIARPVFSFAFPMRDGSVTRLHAWAFRVCIPVSGSHFEGTVPSLRAWALSHQWYRVSKLGRKYWCVHLFGGLTPVMKTHRHRQTDNSFEEKRDPALWWSVPSHLVAARTWVRNEDQGFSPSPSWPWRDGCRPSEEGASGWDLGHGALDKLGDVEQVS